MRVDIEAVEDKKLNYKKVILVIAIVVASIACVYIGLILPKLVSMSNRVKIEQEAKVPEVKGPQVSTAGIREEALIDAVLDQKDIPSREEPKQEYPVITADGIAKI